MELLQGTVEGMRRRGRPRKMWLDNIKDWTRLSIADLLDSTQDRTKWTELCQHLAQQLDLSVAQQLDLSVAQQLDLSVAQQLDLSVAHQLDLSVAQQLDLSIVQQRDCVSGIVPVV